ncbi:MAG: translocation/assembly module TamB domain-containing protein, partial [Candidatus Neomarinimicrobiota bacterium]|nr:translocation/assembly module TamB domain-containing protein [Candidatus Neomarinimicrobiota bacterium]
MNLAILLQSGVMHINDISMTRDTSMGFQLSGTLPLKNSNKRKSMVSLVTTYKDLSMPMIHELIPNFYKIEGRATGNLKLFGSLDETKFEFNTIVNDAVFDRIFLGDVSSKGTYNDNYLNIDYANSKNSEEIITSHGTVPFDLNLSSNRFGQFFIDDSIDYHTKATLNSMLFLSPYILELDSVRGDIDIDLSLSGPASAIIRDGSIEVNDSRVYTMLINNPLIHVGGKALMSNNKMHIEYLTGASINKISNNQLQNLDNVRVAGFIDFTKFFEPDYNLLVSSINKKNIYVEAIPIDLNGNVDSLNISIIGRDTVSISGTIEAVDATLFHEFISEDIGSMLTAGDGIVMSYSLNIPIKDEGKFQNSQVDAIMIGEISLSKIGNQFWNIGGEVYIEDGSILSFKDNFTGLNGYVTFDNDGINPNMDLTASTNISDEQIRLRIAGDLDDADLILESGSGFSESDIIELLTFGTRFEDQEMSSTGFGVQANSVLGSLLETQLEKNLEEMSALKMLKPDEIDISGTASFISGQNMSASERNDLEDFKISAKKKFGNKTYANLSYKKSFSLTNPDQLQIGVEYKLNRNLSLVGNMDDKGNLHLKYRYRYAY